MLLLRLKFNILIFVWLAVIERETTMDLSLKHNRQCAIGEMCVIMSIIYLVVAEHEHRLSRKATGGFVSFWNLRENYYQ